MKIGFILKLAKKFGKSVTGAKKFALKAGKLKKFNKLKKAMKAQKRLAMKKFKKLRQRMFRNMKPGFLKCKILRAEPVDSVTGEVVVEQQDFSIPSRIPMEWDRYYSSHSNRMGVCGRGWETPADVRLEFSDNNTVVFYDGTCAPAYFYSIPEDRPVYEPVDGGMLQKEDRHYTVRVKEDLIYYFLIPQEPVKEIPVDYISDLCGNTVRFIRDKSGLKEINESGGRRISVISRNGFIESMSLVYPYREPCLLAKYQYDESGNLITVYDALNSPYRFIYRNNLLVQHTDRNGLSFYYDYDRFDTDGRCIHAWGDGGLYDYRFKYNEEENITEVTDSLGNTSYLKYNERYMIIEDKDPAGGVTVYEYDEAGRTTAVIDPDGNRTGYEYDRRGNLVKLARPDGKEIVSEFEENKAVRIVDPNGALWQQEWDSRGLLVRQVTPLGAESKCKYDEFGQPIELIDPMGAKTKLDYDNNGNLNIITDALGHATKFGYDMLGNVITRIDPLGHKSTYEYDLKGRLKKALLPGGADIACGYDAEDNLISYKDENGAVTRLEYCGQGEVKRRIEPNGGIVEYHYDTEEQLVAITNQSGERYELKRDSLGRIVSEIDYWGQERKYTYSPGGNLRESIDPLGQLISYKTDPLGRILEKVLPDSMENGQFQTETYSYDANGNLVACGNSNTAIQWKYDQDGQLVEERQGSECIISNEYNPCGDRISRTTKILAGGQEKSRTVKYAYDVAGQATAVEIPGFSPLQFTRNALGQVTREVLGNSLKRTFDYSPEGYLTAQKVLNAEGPVFEQHYTYDRAGNMLNKKDSVFGTDQFRYDPIGQIISHTNPEGRIKRYLNDPAGDLLSTRIKTNDVEWSREGEFEGISYRFDRAGNLKERAGKDDQAKFVWDASQRLIESIKDGCITKYRYDPLGRRISKETDGVTTQFFWDGDALLGDMQVEEKKECIRQREWVYYPESFEPLAMIEGQELYVYHNDPNGCPTRLLDTDGNVVWAAKYDVLGKVERIAVNQVDNPIRMQGQYFDSETGLYYNRYRYFDPIIGAFISQDPLGLMAGENVYAFAPNVLGWVDPLGLSCWSTARKKHWKKVGKKELKKPSGKYSSSNINRMLNGKAPKMTVQVRNRRTGRVSTKDVSIELHHKKIPQRAGGTKVHRASNLDEVTPWQHEAADSFRHTGEDLISVVKDVNIW